MLAGFVLARAAAGLSDSTISGDVSNLEQVRAWFGRPLWEMRPADADAYFGKVMRAAAANTRLKRAQALKTWFAFLELRHKAEIYQLTAYVAECPLDEMNRLRGGGRAALRIPPEAAQVEKLFTRWRQELATCRKFASTARNYAAARLMAQVGLRVNEARMPDLDDVRWDLGRFGKLHVRHGKGAPRVRAAGADGAADQRGGPDAALVHRGRAGPVQRRLRPLRGPAAAERAECRRQGRRRDAAGRAGRGHRGAPA